MFNPKKIIENIVHFEKHFYENNPHGNFLESLVDFCHLFSPLWPPYVSTVISDKDKVVTCLLGEYMKLAIAEGEDIGDRWQFKQVIAENVMAERSYRLYGHDFSQIIAPLHDRAETAIGTFSYFYRTNWTDFPSKTSDFKNEIVQAINTRMPREIIFRFLAEKIFQIADTTQVLITERDEGTDDFFSISEFKKSASGNISENFSRRKLTTGERIYETILNTAQNFIQRSAEGFSVAETPFVEDSVRVFIVSPLISKDDIVGTLNVGFRNDAVFERSTVTMVEEISGYVSICRILDLLTKNQGVVNIPATDITANPIFAGDKTAEGSSIEVMLGVKEALLRGISRIYDVFDKSPGRQTMKAFLPIIDDLEHIGIILTQYLENDKYRYSLQNPVNIKAIFEELIFEAEGKVLHHNIGDKKIGLINRLYADGVAELNGAYVKSIFERLICSIIENSTEADIFFETRREAGMMFVSISNYDQESFSSKIVSRKSGVPENMQLFFRLVQCLFRLNGFEFSVTYPSDTQYSLEAVFKLADSDVVSLTKKQELDVSEALKDKHRILIVDDDDSLRDLMMDILESRHYAVSCFGEAVSAIEAFKKNKYDLVITDLSLPGISGLELAVELKGINPAAPVILVSGWGSEMEKIGEQNPEIDHVLPKPFNLVDFLTMVENSIKPLKF